MPHLLIDGKEYEAKTNFKFERLANEKYSKDAEGNELGGFTNIYLRLLQFENTALADFWNCALHHYKKDKPTLDEIEEALEEEINKDPDVVFKQAFKTLDGAGFFKKQVKSIWNEFSKAPKKKKDETEEEKKERLQNEGMTKMMKERYKELTE